MLPASDSPAIDAGSNALAVDPEGQPLATDQRGFARISNKTVDIGAVEYQQAVAVLAAPAAYDFGAVAVGHNLGEVVTVTNGDQPVTLGSLGLSGGGAFSLTRDQCSSHSLAAHQKCTVGVIFAAHRGRIYSATLTIPDDSAATLATVTVQGSGTSNTVNVSGSGPAGSHLTVTGTTNNPGANCGLVEAHFVSPAPSPPAGYTLVGLPVSFTVTGCTPGATVTLSLDLGTSLPAGASVYKYGPTLADTSNHWYPLPGASLSGSTVTFSITDNGDGDTDPTPGTISDPVAELKALPPLPIPTLSVWGVALLSAMLGLLGGWPRRRRRK